MPQSYSRNFPETNAIVRLDFNGDSHIWTLYFLANDTPDNRLNHNFILKGVLPALTFVEEEWEKMVNGGNADQGAALITTGQIDEKAKIYSNGLDLEAALGDPDFFDTCLNVMYEKLLTFPIPTIASVGGHAFAAGFGLACAHDYRIMNSKRGYLCMNEIDFGAQLPQGLYTTLASKIVHPQTMRKVVVEGHRFTAAEAHQAGIVDFVADAAEYPGAAGTLKLATQVAEKIKIKASKDVWGANKLLLYAPNIAILRTKHATAMKSLYEAPGSKL